MLSFEALTVCYAFETYPIVAADAQHTDAQQFGPCPDLGALLEF